MKDSAGLLSYSARFVADGAACFVGPDWFGLVQDGGLTQPISANGFYYLYEAGPQLISFVSDILRGGADSLTDQTGRRHQFGYWILGFGSAIIDWMRLDTYSTLGRGAKSIDFYQYGPKCFLHYDFYQDNPGKIKMVGELAHEIGAMEEMGLADAYPTQAQVALVFPRSTDYQEYARNSSVMFHEMQWLYLALRHLHRQVDLISEDEVAGGILKRRAYKAVFVAATHLTPEAADAFTQWVADGGVLFCEGGSFRDHLDRPLPKLAELFGAEASELRYEPGMNRAHELWTAPAMDQLMIANGAYAAQLPSTQPTDVVYFRAPLRPSGAQTVARFKDETAALTIQSFGKGKAILCGALLGCAYLYPAKPAELSPGEVNGLAERAGADPRFFYTSPIPQAFSESARKWLELPLTLAGESPLAWASEPLVEVNPLKLDDGYLVLLTDFTRKQDAVDLFLRTTKPIREARLLNKEIAAATFKDGVTQIRIPLKLTQAVRVFVE